LLVLFMDEGRFGRISDLRACWAPCGIRPKVPRQVVRESLYAFAAVAPATAQLCFTLSPRCNTAAMSLFLLELLAAWPERHLLLFLDGAGWHKSRQLPLAERLQLAFLPPYSPECNPTEHIWDEVREKGFANQLFVTLDAAQARLITQLESLACDPPRLHSLIAFPWIEAGLLYL
jgi:transposase